MGLFPGVSSGFSQQTIRPGQEKESFIDHGLALLRDRLRLALLAYDRELRVWDGGPVGIQTDLGSNPAEQGRPNVTTDYLASWRVAFVCGLLSQPRFAANQDPDHSNTHSA